MTPSRPCWAAASSSASPSSNVSVTATDFERPRSFFEAAAALGQRQVDERLAVLLEQVEDVVDERPRALLHRREARAPRVVDGADLAVEDAVGRADGSRQRPRDRVEARS